MALCMFLFCFVAYAQQTVTGNVKDANGDPMIGITVSVDGKPTAVTDLDGNFTIPNAKPTSVIKLSYVGYKDQQITIGKRTTLKIVMQEDDKSLDEVVVVGYGTMKKRDLSGAMSQLKGDDLMKGGAVDLAHGMQGKVAGVTI